MTTQNTRFTCPDCGGAVEKIEEDRLVQYRCRVGHLYSPATALVVHAEREENTLWTGVVVLQEGAELAEKAATLVSGEERERLLGAAKAKRELADQLQRIAIEFGKISLK